MNFCNFACSLLFTVIKCLRSLIPWKITIVVLTDSKVSYKISHLSWNTPHPEWWVMRIVESVMLTIYYCSGFSCICMYSTNTDTLMLQWYTIYYIWKLMIPRKRAFGAAGGELWHIFISSRLEHRFLRIFAGCSWYFMSTRARGWW